MHVSLHTENKKAMYQMGMSLVLQMLDDHEALRDPELLGMMDHVVTAGQDIA